MLVKIQNLILRSLSALTLIAAAVSLTACVPSEAEQTASGNNKNNSNIKKLAISEPANEKETNANQTALTKKIAKADIDPDSPFAEAASKNLETEKNLKWLFGKRPQVGWYLYKPLIAETIGIEPDASPSEFAEALAQWQKAGRLAPTGILDEDTMFAFVGEWQKDRLFSRGIAEPKEMVVAPPSVFYDPGRAETLRQVDREAYDAYRRMLQAAAADPSLNLKADEKGELAPSEKFLKIVSAFRTREYQQKLREASPNSGRAGLAKNSPHFTGRALDLYVGGEPVSTADANRWIQVNTPVYRWMVENAGKFGFRPYFYEPWHWEYVPD